MALSDQINALATRVAAEIRDAIRPRLLPVGGAFGQVLAKTAGTDYATGWVTPSGGGGGGMSLSAVSISPPWSVSGGVMDHSEVVAAPGVGPASILAVLPSPGPDDDNDAEEIAGAVFSAVYESAGNVRIHASFQNPVSGSINLKLMVQ